jgi:YYY domain-containing protein
VVHIIIWWLVVQLLGFIALPFTSVIFRGLPDRGYAFGKALAILLVSYILWLAASAHILPNSQWSIILIIVLLAVGSFFLFIRRRHEIASFIAENRGVIIATEAIFLLSFVLYALVHAYSPDISFGEKSMDFAFLNGILRSEYFPPNDPWLSGHSISYYYFGYLMMAALTKLTGITSAVTFNLSLALIFALTAVGVFSIVYNLVRISRGGFKAAIGFGLMAVAFLLLLGNLMGVLDLLYAHGFGSEGFWKWVSIAGRDSPYHSSEWYPTAYWWWWGATRLINTLALGASFGLDYTITEFPVFSFLFADLHPHVMALPFVLLSLAFFLEIVSSPVLPGLAWLRRNWLKFLVLAICLGALGFINAWDLPTYVFIFALAVLFSVYLVRGKINLRLLGDWGILCLAMIVCAVLFYLPFYFSLQTEIKGFGLVDNIATRPFHFFVFWGLFLFVAISFILAEVWGVLKRKAFSRWGILAAILLPLLPLAAWAVWTLTTEAGAFSLLEKFGHILPLLVVLSLILVVLTKRPRRETNSADNRDKAPLFVMLLLFTGFLLLMGLELFYIRDPHGIRRMNTMFKFYYQVWVFMAIASAFGLYWVTSRWRPMALVGKLARASWWIICIVLLIGSMLYPIAATISFIHHSGYEPTLNGLAFLEKSNPSEYEAIEWLNREVDGAPVIVEASKDEGFEAFRISSRTGLPTILGSPGKERLWRGSDILFRGRVEDIDRIYQSDDISEVRKLLQKYDITYIYVGAREQWQYGNDLGKNFASFMDVAFGNEGVTIYKVRE